MSRTPQEIFESYVYAGAMTRNADALAARADFKDPHHPVEGVWSRLKRSLANLTKHSLDQLTALVKTRLKRMQYRPRLVEGLIAKTGLDLQPP